MANLFKIAAIGALAGAGAAYFLTTEKGKKVAKQVEDLVNDYQNNTDHYHATIAKKFDRLSHQAKETVATVKDQINASQFAPDEGINRLKEVVSQAHQKASDVFAQAKNDMNQQVEQTADQVLSDVEVDDIIIDLSQDQDEEA